MEFCFWGIGSWLDLGMVVGKLQLQMGMDFGVWP